MSEKDEGRIPMPGAQENCREKAREEAGIVFDEHPRGRRGTGKVDADSQSNF